MIVIRNAAAMDAQAIKAVEIEANLGSWTTADYITETLRTDSFFFVSVDHGWVTGFVVARLIMNQASMPCQNELEIYNIAVKNSYRRKGVATFLLKRILESCREKKVSRIFLEVRETNETARKFYQKHGFRITGKRRNFYRNPSEDAVLMELEMKNESET